MASVKFVDLQAQYVEHQDAIEAGIRQVIESGAFILGPPVAELERQLADFVGVRHCITCASGTDALILGLLAAGIGAGDEVITTPFTWFSSAEVIARVGATPVFVDVRADTFCVDPEAIEAAITERTRAILPVSLYGQMADLTSINAIADKHGLAVIEDGAQSFGAKHHGRRSSACSLIGCTSFYPTKVLSCYGDGGAVFTNDDGIAEKIRIRRIHGQDAPQHHVALGMNSRFDSVHAAVMLAKFPAFPAEIDARRRAAAIYDAALADVCQTPVVAPDNEHVYGVYTLQIDDRDRVLAELRARQIPAGVYYPRCVHQQPIAAELGWPRPVLPVAEALVDRVISLPMHPYLDEAQIDAVVTALRASLAGQGGAA